MTSISKEIKKATNPQYINWCFTDFKLLDWDKIYTEYSDIIRYLCRGLEIAPKTKKLHYQGWIQFKSKKRMSRIKNICKSKGIHLTAMFGSEYQNEDYCKKDNKFKTWGTFISQGHRTDLEKALKIIRNGDSMTQIEEIVPNLILRYHSGLKELIKINQKKLTKKFRKVEVLIHTGKTDTGKTRSAVENNPDAFMINGDQLEWWDGYEGEKTLIIDEYNNDVNITKMLKILDGYQLRLSVKGSFTYARWNKVIITTNLQKDEIHPNAKAEHRRALFRRIDTIKVFKKLVC